MGRDTGLPDCCWTLGLLRKLAAVLLSAITDEVGKCCITGAMPPLLQFDAEELPDVVDSASALVAGVTPSNCDRKPRLFG